MITRFYTPQEDSHWEVERGSHQGAEGEEEQECHAYSSLASCGYVCDP